MDLENNRVYFFVLASFLLLIVFLDLRGGFKLAFYKIKGHEEDKVADKNLVANKGEEETEKIPKPFPIENMNDTQVHCPDGGKITRCSCHSRGHVSGCGAPKCIRKAVLCSGGDVILRKILSMAHGFSKAARWEPTEFLPSKSLKDREVFCPKDGFPVACLCIETFQGHREQFNKNYGKPCSHPCRKKAILCSNGWILVRKFAPWLSKQETRDSEVSNLNL